MGSKNGPPRKLLDRTVHSTKKLQSYFEVVLVYIFLESIIYRLRNTLNGNRPSWSFDPEPAQPPSGG
jgi:hypothetical protein